MAKSSQELHTILNRVLQRAMDQTLKGYGGETAWNLRPIDELSQITHKQCIVLTVSSFRFRIMCIMHMTPNTATRQYVAETLGCKLDDLDEAQFIDFLLEVSNNLCGNLKRNLQGSCPPLGMSTPNILDRACLDFDDVVAYSYVVHTAAFRDSTQQPLFVGSAMVTLEGSQEFKIENFAELEAEMREEFDNSGALELF